MHPGKYSSTATRGIADKKVTQAIALIILNLEYIDIVDFTAPIFDRLLVLVEGMPLPK